MIKRYCQHITMVAGFFYDLKEIFLEFQMEYIKSAYNTCPDIAWILISFQPAYFPSLHETQESMLLLIIQQIDSTHSTNSWKKLTKVCCKDLGAPDNYIYYFYSLSSWTHNIYSFCIHYIIPDLGCTCGLVIVQILTRRVTEKNHETMK